MQGYAGYNIMDSAVTIKDSANLDAFSRLRVSNPLILHNSQFTYDLAPLIMEQITLGTGATVTYDSTNRNALMTFSSTPTGGKAYMQSYEYLPYQPGRSQLIFVTFNMVAGVANTLRLTTLLVPATSTVRTVAAWSITWRVTVRVSPAILISRT